MPRLHDRIRRARAISGLTQQELALRLGVQRGAVTQWERPHGSVPHMKHLIAISQHTEVNLEWLGAGRCAPRANMESFDNDADREWRAIDEIEIDCLRALRRMPRRLRSQVVLFLQEIVR